jgi:hypothetical protein
MRLAIAGLVLLALVWSSVALGETFFTPTLNGRKDEYPADSFWGCFMLEGCCYELATTWDADFLWVALCSDSCRRYLGDGGTDLSFFVAIDVDQTFGSGAPQDGYGNANFHGCYMPEYIFYYAGGAGWYEWGYWTGTEWEWRGWRNDNTFYAWDGGGVYCDEMGILWSDLGYPAGVAVTAWITDETVFGGNPPGVLAAWPLANPTGVLPTLTWAYPFFMPHVPGPMPLDGFSPNSVTPDDGTFTGTQPAAWGDIKALYR